MVFLRLSVFFPIPGSELWVWSQLVLGQAFNLVLIFLVGALVFEPLKSGLLLVFNWYLFVICSVYSFSKFSK